MHVAPSITDLLLLVALPVSLPRDMSNNNSAVPAAAAPAGPLPPAASYRVPGRGLSASIDVMPMTDEPLPVELRGTFSSRKKAMQKLKLWLLSHNGLSSQVDKSLSGRHKVVSRCASVIVDGRFTADLMLKGGAARATERKEKELQSATASYQRGPNEKLKKKVARLTKAVEAATAAQAAREAQAKKEINKKVPTSSLEAVCIRRRSLHVPLCVFTNVLIPAC